METNQLKFLALAIAIGAGTTLPVQGSGDWYDAPAPTLQDYLQRLPAKSPQQILAEKKLGKTEKRLDVPASVTALATRFAKDPAEKMQQEVNALLAKAREARCSPADFSLIHDLRDVLISDPKEAAAYIAWRCANLEEFTPDGAPDNVAPSILELDVKLSEASKPMRAHWLYLKGALEFSAGHKGEAEAFFTQVAEKYPDHPRAEAALFMRGRCLVSESRSADYSDRRIGNADLHDKARKCFEEYLKRYPKGRFVADAYGWLGALAWDEEDYTGALSRYAQQVEVPDHPENLKSAGIMMEKVLRKISQDPKGDEAFTIVAQHPQAAMAMLYLILGSSDAGGSLSPYDEGPKDRFVTLREWRANLLPRLASAVAAQSAVYENSPWKSRCLVILAQAASSAGKQKEAVQLLSMAPKNEISDDLLFAKAIVSQRAGQPKDAIPLFRTLLDRFPSSPLAAGARIRLALALQDSHQAGMALVQLRKLADKASAGQDTQEDRPIYMSPPDAEITGIESVFYPNFGNAELSQIKQEIDGLLNFAPIPELATALDGDALEPGFAADLRAVLATRALAHEDFATAKRYMTPAQYGLAAAKLEELTTKAEKAGSPQEKAELLVRLGDAWADNRGKLLGIPLDSVGTKEDLFSTDPSHTEIFRRGNGKALGFKEVDAELEAREELRHATHWWLEAARTVPGSSLSAAARLKILEGMADIARASPYAYERAGAENIASVSRQIYDRLQKECPNSAEAAQAAYWKASGSVTTKPEWYSEGDPYYRLHERGYRWSDFDAFGELQENHTFADGIEDVEKLRGSNTDVPSLQKQVKTFIAAGLSPAARNTLDDLALFLSESGIDDEMAHRYLNLRLDVLAGAYTGEGYAADNDAAIRQRIAQTRSDEKMKPVRDYLDFLDAAVVANHRISVPTKEVSSAKGETFTYVSRDYPALEKMMRQFLKEYSGTKKREAARLLLARAVFRQSWPWYDTFGTAKELRGLPKEPDLKDFQAEPFNSKRVLAELDAYDHDYPSGRYAADIRSMRAAVLWRAGTDWQTALDLTVDLLDHGPSDLAPDASLRLANIFAELADPSHRPALLRAIRKNPRAAELLKAYLEKAPGNLDHPLVLMGAFLGDQLGFTTAAEPPLHK